MFSKLKAGALHYVLVVSVIIAILLMAFIMLLQLQQKVQVKHRLFKSTITNVNDGFDYLLRNKLEVNTQLHKQFSKNIIEETVLKKENWGVFDLAIVTSKVKKESFEKAALLGWKETKQKALYLKENNVPLLLVGSTKIVGDAFLPKQGLKTGNIGGKSYYGNRLLHGNQYLSSSELPEIKNSDIIKRLTKGDLSGIQAEFIQLEERMRLKNSFYNVAKVYKADGTIVLGDIELVGKIIVVSSHKIIVKNSAKLTDVILIAPTVEVEKNTRGNFQVFASKNIVVNERCTLKYPTSLVLCNRENVKENMVEVKEHSLIKGEIIYLQEKNNQLFFTPQIKLNSDAAVYGQMYCNGNTELLGTVKGTVFTENFLTKQFGSTYLNHIYNGSILYNELDSMFVGADIGENKLRITKWLY